MNVFYHAFRRFLVLIGVLAIVLVPAFLVGASTTDTHASPACANCGPLGCTCPDVMRDGALSCEIHSRSSGGFLAWFRAALGGGQGAIECDCIPHGECHFDGKKLDPEISG